MTESRETVKLKDAKTILQLQTENYKGFQNKACEFWPCHPEEEMDGMGCLSCYCPLYFLTCPGKYTRLPDGRKDCSQCTLVHSKGGWEIVQQYMFSKDAPKADKFIEVKNVP